ncbi:MAG: hypothetical protein IJI47_06730 [Eubacterium sp.]|nr:hypothetical protein [Eubacterium sp.]
MSEHLSIDEIIKRAEEIKRAAEEQLQVAEKSLDEKAKNAIDEVVVDEEQVVDRIAKVYERIEEEDDVKEYIPPQKTADKSDNADKTQTMPAVNDESDDVKVVEDVKVFGKEKPAVVAEETESAPADSKTQKVPCLKTESAKDLGKTRQFVAEKKAPQIYVSDTEEDSENDLQKMPTIVAHERIIAGFDYVPADKDTPEEEAMQIRFEGFDDAVETVPKIDEEVAEQILAETRQEKVNKFRLFGPDETDEDLGSHKEVREDYISQDEKEHFLSKLTAKNGSIRLKMYATLFLAVPMVLMLLFKDDAFFPLFLTSHSAYFTCSAILYGLVLAVNVNILIHGFNLRRRFNSDLPIALVSVLIFVHTVLIATDKSLWIDNGVLLTLPGTFALFMSQLGKSRMMSRIIDNFNFLSDSEVKYTVENIANAVDAEIICRGLIEGEPLIKTSVKTDFPSNFMEISTKRELANRISKIVFPLSLLLSGVLFAVVGIMNNFNTAFNMAVCALTITLPCCALYIGNTMLLDLSKGLSNYGSRVCGYEGAAMACGANVMVMEAADLFGANSCEMHGFKTFDGTKVDDAIIYTAAVMTQTKSPLARVFDDAIIGKKSILPIADDITYENSMGISAWIYKDKILVGNRELMSHHGVSLPAKNFEKKYTIKGREALYLAINGNIAAMFIVSYSADPDLKRELRKLEKSGITIVVKSCDPYINEKSIASLFSLPEGFIRIMNYSATRVYEKYSNMHVAKSPAYVVHDGSAMGFVSAMRAAEIIRSSANLISFLTYFGSAIGFALIALLSVLEAFHSITAVNMIIFQAIWNVFVLMLTKIKGMSL